MIITIISDNIDSWNSLKDEVVNAIALNTFKNKLDKYWQNLPINISHPI